MGLRRSQAECRRAWCWSVDTDRTRSDTSSDDLLDKRSLRGIRSWIDPARLVLVVTVRRSNTILYTDRWAETVAFYRDSLSLTVEFENELLRGVRRRPRRIRECGICRPIFDRSRAGWTHARACRSTMSAWSGADLIHVGVAVGEVGQMGADVLDVPRSSGNRPEFWQNGWRSGLDAHAGEAGVAVDAALAEQSHRPASRPRRRRA